MTRERPYKRQTWQAGAIVEIPLANGCRSYGQLSEEPTIGFFDGVFDERPSTDDILLLPLLFKVWVYKSVVVRGLWLKVGRAAVRSDVAREDRFYMQDLFTGRLSLFHSDYAATNWQRPAMLGECVGLECAAVWEAENLEDRLNAHYDGIEDEVTKSLAIDVSKVPRDQRDG